MRPQLFNMFLTRCLPPPGYNASAQWTRIAQESLGLMRDGEVSSSRYATATSSRGQQACSERTAYCCKPERRALHYI